MQYMTRKRNNWTEECNNRSQKKYVYWQEEGDWYRLIQEVLSPTAAGVTWTIQSAFDRFLDQIKKKYSQTCFDGFHDWSFHRFTWNYSSGHNAPIERVIPGIDCLIHSRSDNMNTTRERQTIVKRSMTHIAPYSMPYTKYFRETFYTALYQSKLSLQDWLKYTNHIKTQAMLVLRTKKSAWVGNA